MRKLFYIAIIAVLSLSLQAQKSHSDIIDVKEYTIVLDISDIENQFIQGYTTIRLKPVSENLNQIRLDLQGLNIDSINCDICVINNFSHNDTLIVINLADSYNPDDELNVTVYYNGNPQKDPSGWGGFYFLNGYAFNLGVAFQDIPHNYGRVWYPCNDDFIDRASVNTIITTKPQHTAVCTGELLSVTEDPVTLKKTYHWRIDEPIPTYLVSVAVGSYQKISHIYNGLERSYPVEFYIYPGDSARTANSFVNIDTTLAVYEAKFGPYKWNRVGYVAVPFSSGAMEHVTNIAMGRAFIDGSLTYEDLFYHDLAHMWFGNAITCSSAEDMWINEGWATFSETIFYEFVKSKETALAFRRKSHEAVLRYYPVEDGGFHALYPMSQDLTYSRTVYEKGASVAHALRGYLGDDIFFPAITALINNFTYQSISSYNIRDFLSNYTGVDLTDFFQEWVFSPGFVHYSIDSTISVNNGSGYDVTVFVKQKLRGRDSFANGNKVEINFMDENYEIISDVIEFDGEFGEKTFNIPFNPALVMVDYYEKTSDATIKEPKFISSTGYKTYNYTYFKANVQSVNNEKDAFLRVTHNWAAPDTFKNPIQGLKIANHRYWTIEGVFPQGFLAKGEFSYNTATTASGYVDNDFITNSLDSLVLLYRPNRSADWTIEPATHNKVIKRFTVDSLKVGEYSLAIWDWDSYVNAKEYKLADNINIYPNPNNGNFYFSTGKEFCGNLEIYNLNGIRIYEKQLNSVTEAYHQVNLPELNDGIYIFILKDKYSKIVSKRKFVVQK
jgi:aminopeptidase N